MAKPRNKRYKYESDTSVMENKPPQWFPLLTELLVLATMAVRKDGIGRFSRLAGQVENAISSGVYYPNESYMCGICGYQGMCEKW